MTTFRVFAWGKVDLKQAYLVWRAEGTGRPPFAELGPKVLRRLVSSLVLATHRVPIPAGYEDPRP